MKSSSAARPKPTLPNPTPANPDVLVNSSKIAATADKNTINDVAHLAQVSKKTVSRVLNDSPLVRPKTREKVQAAMRELGYTPDPQARALAFGRSFLIGLIFDNPTAQYVMNIQYGVLDVLRGTDFELVVHPCDSRQPDYIDGVLKFVQQQRPWAVLLVPRVSEDQALASALQALGCRYVRIASVLLDQPENMVLTQDRMACAQAAEYLQSLGHRHIGLITGPHRYRSAMERGEGFVEALARRGVELSAEMQYQGAYTFESGVEGAERLLSQTPRPSAIFACNDEMAAGVYKAALRRGLSIPAELSIVGYDDSPLASQLWPPLTSLRVPIRELGQQAARMLLKGKAMEGAELKAFSVLPTLVVRDSCQAPKPTP
jgi:LacI family transcriptional regulator